MFYYINQEFWKKYWMPIRWIASMHGNSRRHTHPPMVSRHYRDYMPLELEEFLVGDWEKVFKKWGTYQKPKMI